MKKSVKKELLYLDNNIILFILLKNETIEQLKKI